MDRLTKTTGPDGKEFTPCSLCNLGGSAACKVIKDRSACWEMEVYERLAEYEDTGFTPGEIAVAVGRAIKNGKSRKDR